MREDNIYGYFAFGYNYSLLRQRNGATSEHLIREGIDSVLSFFDKLDMPVSKQISAGLRKIAADIKLGSENKVGNEAIEKIREELKKLDPSAMAELKLRTAYILSSSRYPIEKLMKDCGDLLGTGVFKRMAVSTQTDFQLACKQIGLQQPTSAAFHLMRALEAEVRSLYCAFKKTKRLKVLLWGPMTDQLRTKNNPKPSEKLLSHLDGMRKHFRNPTQHPELFYSMDEAHDLLNSTVVAINMIRREIPKSD